MLTEGSGLSELARLSEVDITDVGVKGAKDFFEAKVRQVGEGKVFETTLKYSFKFNILEYLRII